MRCKNCDYRLWNLRSRRCPECGAPFRPSEYEFVINSVRFCCPHCDKGYYGSGEKGHLVPAAFDCVSCGRHIQMDEMVLLPTEGVAEEQTKIELSPWLEWKERGRLRAWLSTIGWALVGPVRLIQMTPVDSSVGQACGFAMVTLLGLLIAATPFLLIPMSFIAWGPLGGWAGVGGLAGLGLGLGIAFAIAVTATVGGIAIWGAVTHGLLSLTGKTQAGAGRTYQAICYSSGANVVSAVPCFGIYFGWLWWAISAVLMVKEGQQVHGARAAFAVLFLPVLLITTATGLYVAVALPWISAGPSLAMSGATVQMAQRQIAEAEVQSMLLNVRTYATGNAGRRPAHAIEMTTDPSTATVFVANGSGTTEEDIPVGGTTLAQFRSLPPSKQRSVAQTAISALPKQTIAHRLGDYVFTYHGIDLRAPDAGLWLVIRSPDPDSSAPASLPTVFVGLADGSVLGIPLDLLATRLAEQNDLRAKHALPPLPDPSRVTHASPAVAGR